MRQPSDLRAPQPMARKKVVIVDSGLRNLGGHNFSYTAMVRRALEKRGHEVTVLAHRHLLRELVAETGYRPVFSFGAYDFPPGGGRAAGFAYQVAQGVVFAQELEAALGEPDLIFCHTVGEFELLGWRLLLRKRALPGRLSILLRRTPGFRHVSRFKRGVHPLWRWIPSCLAAISARMGDRFTLLTDSELLTEDFATIYSGRIVTMPIPLAESLAQAATQPGERLRFGYLGDARPAKGFPMLPELVRTLPDELRARVEFVFQCSGVASAADGAERPQAVRELLQLPCRLVTERLTEDEYAALCRSMDVILLPYDHDTYRDATSGIFAEAVALGKPVVCSSDTWMAHELAKSGGGIVFPRGDAAAFRASVAQAIRDYPALAERARAFAPQWNRFHNAETLADLLCE